LTENKKRETNLLKEESWRRRTENNNREEGEKGKKTIIIGPLMCCVLISWHGDSAYLEGKFKGFLPDGVRIVVGRKKGEGQQR